MDWKIVSTAIIDAGKTAPAVFNMVAALLAFTGVIITILVQGYRLRRQFAHDRKLKDRDREMALRKEVYLSAAEAISAGVRSLNNFAKTDLSNNDVTEDYLSKASALHKAFVIASPETFAAIDAFTSSLAGSYIKLLVPRQVLLNLIKQQQLHQESIKRNEQERDHTTTLLRNQNIRQSERDLLNKKLDFTEIKITGASEQLSALLPEIAEHHIELMRACIDEGAMASRLSIAALVPIRNELEMPLNKDRFDAILEASIKRNSAALQGLLDTLMPVKPQKRDV